MNIRHVSRTISLARRNFFANGKRNFMSVLTVVLGSLAIGAVFTVNENVDHHVDGLIARSGGPNIYVNLRSPMLHFTEADVKNLAGLTSARYAVINAEINVNVLNKDQSAGLTAIHAGDKYAQARPIELQKGQFLSAWDESGNSRNVVLSPEAAVKLGLADPLGKTITLSFDGRRVDGLVIGIASPVFEMDDRGYIWLPPKFFGELWSLQGYQHLVVGSSGYSGLENFEQEVAAYMEPRFKSNFEIYNPKTYFERLRREYQTFVTAGAAIGVLALLGGSVGVMNLMMIGIQLRTREIGLYRALGFPTAIVLLAFLFEALMILSFGGLLGSVLGCFTGLAIASQVVTAPPFLSEEAFVLAFSSSLVVGFVFAYIPASRASKMDTVEALRA